MVKMTWSKEEREEIEAIKGEVSDIRRALMEPPAGGGDSLIVRATKAVEFLERGGWAGKWIVRGVMTIAAMGAAIVQFKGWFFR